MTNRPKTIRPSYLDGLRCKPEVLAQLQRLDLAGATLQAEIRRACPPGTHEVESLFSGGSRKRKTDDLLRALEALEMALMFARGGLLCLESSYAVDPMWKKGPR